jgi:hypothetical protein
MIDMFKSQTFKYTKYMVFYFCLRHHSHVIMNVLDNILIFFDPWNDKTEKKTRSDYVRVLPKTYRKIILLSLPFLRF